MIFRLYHSRRPLDNRITMVGTYIYNSNNRYLLALRYIRVVGACIVFYFFLNQKRFPENRILFLHIRTHVRTSAHEHTHIHFYIFKKDEFEIMYLN